MKDRITIVLADDHGVVREALRGLLETEPQFAVVGEAEDGLVAVDLVERLTPDILVVDLVMPGLGGLDVTRQVVRRSPKTRVIILSMHHDEAVVLQALKNGARGYVRKHATAADLIHAIREVSEGHLYLSSPFSDKAIEAYRGMAEEAAIDPYESLTERERQVLHLAAEGLTHAQVGERLGISPRTAETHRAHVAQKLGLRRQIDLIRYALRRGMLLDDDETPQSHPPRT